MPSLVLAQNIAGALKSSLGGSSGNTYTSGTSADMNQIIASECTKYLVENAKVQVSYVGTVSGAPESGTDLLPISGTVAPSVQGSPQGWLDTLGLNISVGFLTLPGPILKPLAPHVSLQVPNTKLSGFVPLGACPGVTEASDPALEFWKLVATGIFQMLETQVSAPFPASLAGTGIAPVTKLVVL